MKRTGGGGWRGCGRRSITSARTTFSRRWRTSSPSCRRTTRSACSSTPPRSTPPGTRTSLPDGIGRRWSGAVGAASSSGGDPARQLLAQPRARRGERRAAHRRARRGPGRPRRRRPCLPRPRAHQRRSGTRRRVGGLDSVGSAFGPVQPFPRGLRARPRLIAREARRVSRVGPVPAARGAGRLASAGETSVAPITARAWLRGRDPGLVTVRRAARAAIVACVGFYVCRYGLHRPVLATYALFGTIALGALSQIPGTAAQRARTLIAVLPAGAVLVTVGTVLSVSTWSAALGMFVLGFLITYAGVGGPRLVGLVSGMQLLYILPCFPPYDPGSLGYRLGGLTLAVVLLAVAELALWPDRPPVPYQRRLADAVLALADCLDAGGDEVDGDPRARGRLAARLPEATEAAEAIRPSRLP